MTHAKLGIRKPASVSAQGEIAQLVLFRLDEHRYALPLQMVERIVRAVAVTPLPKGPSVILGVIDIAGQIIPVFNLRQRFGLPARKIDPANQFAIARTAHWTVALSFDCADGVMECPNNAITHAASIAPGLGHVIGVVQLEDGLVLIQDLEQFLCQDEARALDEALASETTRGG